MTKSLAHQIVEEIDKVEFFNLNIKLLGSIVCKILEGKAYFLYLKEDGRKKLVAHRTIKREAESRGKRVGRLSFNLTVERKDYELVIKGPGKLLTPEHCQELKSILVILSRAVTATQISKERIIETQIINELNLGIITQLNERKVIKDLEKAAWKMTGIKGIMLFYLIDDKLVGIEHTLSLKSLPERLYDQLFKKKALFSMVPKKQGPFAPIIKSPSTELLFIPIIIKNECCGFFVVYEDIKSNRGLLITRIKFLANQASLALERIRLFQRLNRTLKETHGLQEMTKVMLSSFDFHSLIDEILQKAQKVLNFEKMLFSIFNPETRCFDRISGVGIPKKKLEQAKRVHPPFDVINKLLQERYRISNSYYIPAQEVDEEIYNYAVYKVSTKDKRRGNIWHPLDILISPIYSKNRELVGILSLGEPKNNLVPNFEKIRLLETFGDFLGLAIENGRLFKKIENLSYTDELTGVKNYRFLRETLTSLIQQSVSPTAIVIIDLDDFKRYNDQFGHLYGDRVLKIFSQGLEGLIRKKGYVVRYGGDEFIIILPRIGLRRCRNIIKRVKQYFRNEQLLNMENGIPFSYGIAVYPDDGVDFGELIDRADKLLYQAKSHKDVKA